MPLHGLVIFGSVSVKKYLGESLGRQTLIRKFGIEYVLVALKWLSDRRHLPLTAQHWGLYRIVHKLCFRQLSRFPNLTSPEEYNDKIQWLKIFDQDEEVIKCTDKLGGRKYVKETLGDGFLPVLYSSANDFSSIDLDVLPNSFVVKTNHDSGSVFLIRDKSQADFVDIDRKIQSSLSRKYGVKHGEWQYSHIKPRVFAEEFIGPLNTACAPPDYKFHCSAGRVKWLQYIFDRGEETKETIVDIDGQALDIHFDHLMQHSMQFTKPENWPELIKVAEKLSKPFKYIRVDLYLVNEKIYVGELSFHPLRGCYKGGGQKVLGNLLDFEMDTYKPLYEDSPEK